MPAALQHLAGQPLKTFFDTFLSKQFRDAMAHFTLKKGSTLDVSSASNLSRFADVAFVSDLCVRELISAHEEHLRAISVD